MRVFSHNRFLIALMKLRQKVKSQPAIVSAAQLWKRARVILICFPDEYRERVAAEPAVRSIVEAYPQKRFFILTTKALAERWLNVELIRIRKGDLNLFSLPSSEFTRYMQDKAIDVAIDLWPSFNLTNAYLCGCSGATLRVSFGNQHAPAFYNLLVIPRGPEGSLSRGYEVMVETVLNLERSEAEIED